VTSQIIFALLACITHLKRTTGPIITVDAGQQL
jgi:hypothetical protein